MGDGRLGPGRLGLGRLGLGRLGLDGLAGGSLAPGERVLSSATADSGDLLVATNLGLWVMSPGRDAVRHYWDEIDRATWGEGVLTVERLVGDRSRLVHRLPRPGRLPQLVRDRVTSSIVVSERSAVPGGHVRVVARRRPGLDSLRWALLYDPGELAGDPAARAAAQELLARHQSHVGAGGEDGPAQRWENESRFSGGRTSPGPGTD